MTTPHRIALLAVTSVLAVGCGPEPAAAAPAAPAATTGPITLTVNATDAPRAILHAHVAIPAHAGEMVLAYPKWIPGEHGPTGPLLNVVNLRTSANGQSIAWRRDDAEMYDMHVAVPPGAKELAVDFDVVSTGVGAFGAGGSTTHNLIDLSWNQLVFYPKGARASALVVKSSLKLPAGWSFGTALADDGTRDGTTTFKPVSLETLVDSPVIAGQYAKTFDLGVVRGAPHALTLVGDSADALAVPQATIDAWKKLIVEANALFGARHYDSYRFLVVATDKLPTYGLEHHQSSEDHVPERGYTDDDARRAMADLLSHEYVHSWNGKYRRPRGLATPSFGEPMHGELLWVYEGLTEYLGWVLATRSGLASLDDSKARVAGIVAGLDTPGRGWRPLADTARGAQVLYNAPEAFDSLRRNVDFYPEGLLLWLEVDVTIRQKTNGAKSLDDFCKAFHGGADGHAEVRPYDLDEVARTLNAIAPLDWKGFFDERVYRVASKVPTGGVEGAGFKLGWVEKKPELYSAREKVFKFTSYEPTLGFYLKEEGVIGDVRGNGPSAKAGLVPGMKLLGVDSRKYSGEVMKDALARAKTGTAPLALLVEEGGYFRTVTVDYHGGERYSALERDANKPDLLTPILSAKGH